MHALLTKAPSASACAIAPLTSSLPPKSYSVTASLVPDKNPQSTVELGQNFQTAAIGKAVAACVIQLGST
jgi:uncharacterized protein involved in exopolysaccharide biosynthesis